MSRARSTSTCLALGDGAQGVDQVQLGGRVGGGLEGLHGAPHDGLHRVAELLPALGQRDEGLLGAPPVAGLRRASTTQVATLVVRPRRPPVSSAFPMPSRSTASPKPGAPPSLAMRLSSGNLAFTNSVKSCSSSFLFLVGIRA